ncbi:MAG: hypothetical protein E4H36_01705 [Spirochaetales bacterium]|nr:MAG: hypothetical protein E4H36_01705 [Spirochaetales bacterium]
MAKRNIILLVCIMSMWTVSGVFSQETNTNQKTQLSEQAAGVAEKPAAATAAETDESTLLLGAQTDTAAGAGTGADNGGAGQRLKGGSFTLWDFLRMILILAAVVAAIYFIFRLLKKKTGPKLQDAELFKILSTQVIANNRSLHLVEVGRQIFLVGAGENAVNLVSEVTDKETLDEIHLKAAEFKESEQKSFIEKLSGFFKPVNGDSAARLNAAGLKNQGAVLTGLNPPGMAAPPHNPADFFKRQRERLKRF